MSAVRSSARQPRSSYFDVVGAPGPDDSSDGEEEEEVAPVHVHRRPRPSLESPVPQHLAGVDYQQQQQQQQQGGSGEALRRQALRRSAEKAAAVGQPAQPGPEAVLADAAAPGGSGGAAAPSALVRDLPNQLQPQPAAPPPPASAPRAAGSLPPPPPLQHQHQQPGAARPAPLAQQHQAQRPRQPASFLAGAKAALLEATAAGSQPLQQRAQQHELPAAPAHLHANGGTALPRSPNSRKQAATRSGQAPPLTLVRSPHAAGGLAAPPAPPPIAAAAPAAELTPQVAQLRLERTPGAVPPTGTSTGGLSGLSDLDEDFLNRVASLERKATLASAQGQLAQQGVAQQQAQQQLQQPGGGPPQGGALQQQHQQLHQQQQQPQPQPQQQNGALHPPAYQAPAPAAPAARVSIAGQLFPELLQRGPSSAEAPRTGWSDTPDSACLAALDQLERQAAAAGSGAAEPAAAAPGESPVPARQLTFTPTGAGAAAAAGLPSRVTPPSGPLPTSHLGRSALQQAAATVAAQQQEHLLPPLVAAQAQGQQQPQAQHAAAAAQAAVQAATQPHKRSLAASIALEQIAAQHSPAAKQLQHPPPSVPLGPPAAAGADEPAIKRHRGDGAAEQPQGAAQPPAHPQPQEHEAVAAAAAPAGPEEQQQEQEAEQQQQQQAAEQQAEDLMDLDLPPPEGAALPHTAQPVAPVTAEPYPYLYSEEEEDSEEEEAERNLPMLSQYVQSGSRPSSRRGQQEERARDARTPPSRLGVRGGEDGPSPLGGQLPGSGGGQPSPLLSADPAMLESYLEPDVAAAFRQATGISGRLYDWQRDCLTMEGVLEGSNLVYCAPTSGGKSLVAEVLMLRRIAMTQRPAMVVLPFVSICVEKSEHLSKVLAAMGREVKEHYGGSNSMAPLGPTTGAIVCTIEKANSIINRMLEDQTLNLLSCLVVDELHMVGEDQRGYQLELLLTKLRYAAARCEADDIYMSEGLQIIGMSATLPNVDQVANWLEAKLYVTDYRPVELQAYMKQGLALKDEDMQVVRSLEVPQGWEVGGKNGDSDHTALLARETVQGGHSVLIFCGTKMACEISAKRAARMIDIPERRLKGKGWSDSERPSRASLLEELRRVPGGPDAGLLECLSKGAAFHHAGLSNEEREIVETAYRCGAVSVLCATSTLAAGVNLPARRVIIRHPWKGRPSSPIDGISFRQMAGRAGRAGIDTYGECILVCQDIPPALCSKLLTSGTPPVESCLVEEKRGMKRAMLEVVASGAVVQPIQVKRYIECTLLAAMNDYQRVAAITVEALHWLRHKEHQFIYWDDESAAYQPTAFGKAVLASGMPPEDCIKLKADLTRARESFVLTTELHLTYLCVPITDTVAFLDWKKFHAMLGTLNGAEASVAQKVGVDRHFVQSIAYGFGSNNNPDKERICKRFWTALMLTDIIAEEPILDVCKKYGVRRAEIQSLQDKASRNALMTAAFCERLGWYDLEALIAKFQSRVLHGVKPEILALTEIPFVKAYTARILYKAGLRTPEAVAAVENVEQIVSILANSANPDSRNPTLLRRQALKILRGARELLNRRARELREQAEEMLKTVKQADKAEVAGGDPADAATPAAADADAQPGPQDAQQQQQQQQQGPESAAAAAAGGAEERPAAAGGAGSGRAAADRGSGRSAQGSGRSAGAAAGGGAPSWRSGGRGSGGTTGAAAAGEASDEEGDAGDLLESPPEAELPPDPWRFGGQGGVHELDTPEAVREMCAVLLAPQQAQQGQQEGQQQQRYEFVGFQFDTVAVGSAAGAAAALPRGPTAAQRRDNAAHDKQSADVGVRVEGVALSWRAGQAFYVPLHRRADLLAELAPLFASSALEKATWNLRAQLAALVKALGRGVLGTPGVEDAGCPLALRDPLVDVRIAAWLSTPDEKRLRDENVHSLGPRSELFTLSSMLKIKGGPAVWAASTQGMQAADARLGHRRADAGRQAAMACKMWQLLRSRLGGEELLAPLWRTEMPLVRVIVDMEAAGVGVDEAVFNAERPQLVRRIEELEELAHVEAKGEKFNLGAPQEVSRVLFDVLRIPPPPSAKELKSGGWSTGQEVLLEIAGEHAIARIIWEHRKLSTLLNRFVEAFKMYLTHAESVAYPGGRTLKRIRGSINQTCADTGRLAMDEPNLQTVPKPLDYKVLLTASEAVAAGSDGGQASAHAPRTSNLRAAFVAPPGFVLLSADYRQIEFRLMAHFSGDAHLTRIFSEDGADPFQLLAAQWQGIPADQVTPQQRAHAKQLTYGLLYGMGASKLAEELGCSLVEAREAQDRFKRSLPAIETWQSRVVEKCRQQGFVETLAGRRRYLPDINSRNGNARAAAERKAKNTVCQGSAADLAKAAMVRIHSALGYAVPPGGARLVLQIHDEFLLEVAAHLLEPVARLVRNTMESGVVAASQGAALRVPLRVRLAFGRSWGELQELELP